MSESDPKYTEEDALRIATQAVRAAMSSTVSLPRDQAAEIAAAAARVAVQEGNARMFAMLGYDIADMNDVKRLRDNLSFTEKLHMGSANLAAALVKAVAVAIVLVILGWITLGAKDTLGGHETPKFH